MSKVLLDTDILSEYLKGHDKVVARHAASYASQHGAFTFTSVTVHEIVFGLEFKGASAQLAKALAWLNQNEQITPTASDYQEAANHQSHGAKTRLHSRTAGLFNCRCRGSAWPSGGDGEHGRFSGHTENRRQPHHQELARLLNLNASSRKLKPSESVTLT